MKYAIPRSLLLSCLLVFGGCGASQEYSYNAPADIGDGLAVGSVADVGVDRALVAEGISAIWRAEYTGVHSVLMYKDGKLVLEEYFKGHKFAYEAEGHHGELIDWDRDTPHRVMSVSKSITSACVGIAVDKGFIQSVDQSIFDYLPDYSRFKTEGREKITIEHLLTMTAGLEWNEWAIPYGNRSNDIIQAYLSDDPIAFILSKSMIAEPGEGFNYSGACNLLLAEIIKNASGMNLDEFSGKYLFGPLGVEPYVWREYSGAIDGAGGVLITPRDMLKIGVLFLNEGVWQGERILSEDWVRKSAESYPGNNWTNNWGDDYGLRGYGYSWWNHRFVSAGTRIDIFYAAGWGGQYIMVIPALSSVVVFTGGNYTSPRPCFEILKKYLVAAF